jgi:hypothetical protein
MFSPQRTTIRKLSESHPEAAACQESQHAVPQQVATSQENLSAQGKNDGKNREESPEKRR